jgi:hypothetical protein
MPTPTAAIVPSRRSGIPAITSMAATVKTITSVVPRSGWLKISAQAAPTTINSGLARSFMSITRSGRLASRVAQ